MFEELLLPFEDFTLKSKGWYHTNQTNDFIIFRSGDMWRILMTTSVQTEVFETKSLKEAYQLAFAKLQQDPTLIFSKQLRRKSRYQIGAKTHTNLMCPYLTIYRSAEGWRIDKKLQDKVFEDLDIQLQVFSSRSQAISFLYNMLVQNLDSIYRYSRKFYGLYTVESAIKAFQTDMDFKLSHGLWWLMFIRPEVDIQKLFDTV